MNDFDFLVIMMNTQVKWEKANLQIVFNTSHLKTLKWNRKNFKD